MISALKDEVVDGPYKYRLSRGGASSDKYGPCEVCGGFVSDVYLQVESRRYEFELNDKKHVGYTAALCNTMFGHCECLVSRRRFPCILPVAK